MTRIDLNTNTNVQNANGSNNRMGGVAGMC